MRNSAIVTVSVVIITKNQKDFLQKSIPSIKSQNFKGGFEIIVVDSGSTDGAIEYLKKEKVKLVQIRPEEFGFAKAFNIGANIGSSKYIVRLSGDAIPIGNNWLNELITPFKNPFIGAVYGKYCISGKAGFTYPNFWSADLFPDQK